jgi:hypothetical protein
MSGRVSVRDGAIYLSADIVATYFRGIEAVIVLIHDLELQILPVHQATSGGCLLKIRNAAGDRVAQARDVFQDQELLDYSADNLTARWNSECGALCVELKYSIAN